MSRSELLTSPWPLRRAARRQQPEGRLPLRLLRGQAAPGDLILRHDVDLSLEAALALAELEAGVGVSSTWFLMTRSAFYNLDSPRGAHVLARLRELGGRIAHHARLAGRRPRQPLRGHVSPGTTPSPPT